MRKIDYSVLDNVLIESYCEIFNSIESDVNFNLINCNIFKKESTDIIDFKYIIASDFEELLRISNELKKWNNNFNKIKYDKKKKKNITTNEFSYIFNYKKFHSKIAAFFMQNMNLSNICYYCDEQHISSFSDFQSDYSDVFDFFKNAEKKELLMIKGLGKASVEKIINKRLIKKDFNIKQFKELKLKITLNSVESSFKGLFTHNYFTLDHVLPQADYPFFSLSLYNFVPCCYSCNSKFKKKINFEKDVIKSSPTSSKFSICDSFQYRLLSNEKNLLDDKNINLLSMLDYTLLRAVPCLEEDYLNDSSFQEDYINQKDLVDEYLQMFKLNGRYLNHKKLAIDLAKKRIRYSDSQLRDIANTLKISENFIKKDVFGEVLFDKDADVPLSKLQRDIAKQFKIIND